MLEKATHALGYHDPAGERRGGPLGYVACGIACLPSFIFSLTYARVMLGDRRFDQFWKMDVALAYYLSLGASALAIVIATVGLAMRHRRSALGALLGTADVAATMLIWPTFNAVKCVAFAS